MPSASASALSVDVEEFYSVLKWISESDNLIHWQEGQSSSSNQWPLPLHGLHGLYVC